MAERLLEACAKTDQVLGPCLTATSTGGLWNVASTYEGVKAEVTNCDARCRGS